MITKIHLKRILKRSAGWAAVLTSHLAGDSGPDQACILTYHRVVGLDFTDPSLDNWNVPPKMFEKQIAALSESAEIVPLLDLPRRLALAQTNTKPLVSITFDDGYANFYTEAVPILKRYGAHATMFIVTSWVGSTEPMPFDRWGRKNRDRAAAEAWRPMSWDEIERCLESNVVAIGGHSHRHLDGRECGPEQLIDEAQQSREVLVHRLGGAHARAYAYPYGSTRLGELTPEYIDAVRDAGYELAVSTDLGLADSRSQLFALPRVEAYGLDSPAVLRAKARGAIAPYHFTDWLRTAKRSG